MAFLKGIMEGEANLNLGLAITLEFGKLMYLILSVNKTWFMLRVEAIPLDCLLKQNLLLSLERKPTVVFFKAIVYIGIVEICQYWL